MPELRSGVRRGRQAKPIEGDQKVTERRTRGRPPTTAAAKKRTNKKKTIDENIARGSAPRTTPFQANKEEAVRVLEGVKEEVGEKEMDDYDSGGGRSGDKGLAAEDEGSTAPLPEKV